MKKQITNKNRINHITLCIAALYIVYAALVFYIMLPPINWHSIAFWKFLFFTIGPLAGYMIYYILSDKNEIFKIIFKTEYEQELAFLKIGDVLDILYSDSEGINQIQEIK